MHTEDTISGIFDNLSPEDFRTTEVHQGAVTHTDFDEFLAAQIHSTHIAFAASDGTPTSVAFLDNGIMVRMFVPTDEEDMGEFLARIKSEGRLIHATRFFIYRTTLVASQELADDGSYIDGNDAEAQEKAVKLGIENPGLIWYGADSRSGQRSLGTFVADGMSLVRPVKGHPAQPYELFDRVLDTGPAA